MKDIEDRLQRYRPAAPPVELRTRITDRPSPAPVLPSRVGLLVEWLPAAAVFLATLTLYQLAGNIRDGLRGTTSAADSAREEARRILIANFGDDSTAREGIEQLLDRDRTADNRSDGAPTWSEVEAIRD